MKYYFICKGCMHRHSYPPENPNCGYCGHEFEPTLPTYPEFPEDSPENEDDGVVFISRIIIGVCLGIFLARVLEVAILGIIYLILKLFS